MAKPIIVTGLDIGSSKVCAVLLEIDTTDPNASRILGTYAIPSRGVERGHIVDLNLAIDSVSKVLDRLSDKTGKKTENIYANISGRSIMAQKARGMISLSIRGREITENDMKRCVRVASTTRLPFEIDIIHNVVHSYIIDDQTQVLNPIGLYGSRLAVEIYVITAGVNHMQNLKKVVDSCGYELKEVIFSGLADSYSLLDDEDRRSNILLINMGGSLTELTMFTEGVIRYVEVMPLGASDVKGSLEEDECLGRIVTRIKEKTDEFLSHGAVFSSAAITGGGSFIDGMIEALESGTGMAIEAGVVKHLKGNISPTESRPATTAIGLARYALLEKYKPAAQKEPMGLVKNISSKVVDIFNNYF